MYIFNHNIITYHLNVEQTFVLHVTEIYEIVNTYASTSIKNKNISTKVNE